MIPALWIFSDPSETPPARIADLRNALLLKGVSLHDRPVSGDGMPGICFFADIPDGMNKTLSARRASVDCRILGVNLRDRADCFDGCWSLLEAGLDDILEWSSPDTLAASIIDRIVRWEEIDRAIALPPVSTTLVGKAPAWRAALRQLVEAASSGRRPVLITGESGTGKELAARCLHQLGDARDGNLVTVDCTTIVPTLSGSEFFGHERGAFTGANSAREGAFGLVDGGTLFLDEIGELPLTLQAELLRVIQEGTYKRVGSNLWQQTSFRLICATNRDLDQEVEAGKFRADLYYRIAGWKIRLPALGERIEDIPLLAEHFARQERPDLKPPLFDAMVQQYLGSRPYPGNVRELKQLIARMVSGHIGCGPVSIGSVPPEARPAGGDVAQNWRSNEFVRSIYRALTSGFSLKQIGAAAEDEAIRIAVGEEKGNLQRAAQRLGVTDRALQIRRARQRLDHSPVDDKS